MFYIVIDERANRRFQIDAKVPAEASVFGGERGGNERARQRVGRGPVADIPFRRFYFGDEAVVAVEHYPRWAVCFQADVGEAEGERGKNK
jgi:hypothetical protein